MLELGIGLIIGLSAGMGGTYMFLKEVVKRSTSAKNIDYKKRWLAAVGLLGSEGALSDEQIQQLTVGISEEPSVLRTNNQLCAMSGFSSDRRDAEIARARAGLPPQDNLNGMFSSDKKDVIKTRAKHGTG